MGNSLDNSWDGGRQRSGRAVRWAVSLLVVALGVALLAWKGGDLLVVSEPLPAHAQVAVTLDGSAAAVRARRAEAMRLLADGRVSRVLMSVVEVGYWGQNIPQVARHYLEEKYGKAAADHVTFCLMPESVNSTAEEAAVLEQCLAQQDWRSVIVVTSNYHTRRARLIWRQTLAGAHPPFQMWIDGVEDGDFEPVRWWGKRIYAKTWLEETTKLLWTEVVGIKVWR